MKEEYDYGECELCAAPLEERLINRDFWIRGNLIVIEEVPAGICPRCGEKVVRGDVGQRIALLLENSEKIAQARRITVPALKYEREAIA